MRISDWSSDVCSSDLSKSRPAPSRRRPRRRGSRRRDRAARSPWVSGTWADKEGRARDRKSVVEGKSVSVRVDLGGRRIIKNKKSKELEHIHRTTKTHSNGRQ